MANYTVHLFCNLHGNVCKQFIYMEIQAVVHLHHPMFQVVSLLKFRILTFSNGICQTMYPMKMKLGEVVLNVLKYP